MSVQPVVFAERSEARNSTASATSSGQDAARQEVPLAVEVLELVDADALGARPARGGRPRTRAASRWKTASGFTMFERMPCGAALERQDLGQLRLGGLGGGVGGEVLARRHDVLGGHEDERAAEPLGA